MNAPLARLLAGHLENLEILMLSYYGNETPPPSPSAMTRDEEHALFVAYRKRRTAPVRDRLVRQYLCWAFGMASRFKGPRLCFDEAVGVANEGLMEALNDFDPSLGFRFTTYAAWAVRRKLIRAIVNTYPVHVSDHVRKKWRLAAPAKDAGQMLKDGAEPRTFEEFFDRLGETADADIAQLHEQPVDAPFAPAPGESPADLAELGSREEALAKALLKLTPLERKVIEARHYRGAPESFQDIARRLRVSKSSARDAYDTALVRLKKFFSKEI